jgi:ribosome recycling factor
MVDYYGTPTPIKKLAQLNALEARLITIQPFDRSAISEIEKAIHKANWLLARLGRQDRARADPELTEERRKVLVKQVKQLGEDHKVGVRNAPRRGGPGQGDAEGRRPGRGRRAPPDRTRSRS